MCNFQVVKTSLTFLRVNATNVSIQVFLVMRFVVTRANADLLLKRAKRDAFEKNLDSLKRVCSVYH